MAGNSQASAFGRAAPFLRRRQPLGEVTEPAEQPEERERSQARGKARPTPATGAGDRGGRHGRNAAGLLNRAGEPSRSLKLGDAGDLQLPRSNPGGRPRTRREARAQATIRGGLVARFASGADLVDVSAIFRSACMLRVKTGSQRMCFAHPLPSKKTFWFSILLLQRAKRA